MIKNEAIQLGARVFVIIEGRKLLGRIGFIVLIFFGLLTGLVSKLPFFWDTIQLGSIHAEYFIQTRFSSFLFPDQIDSGHPPFFGMYLALAWKIWGKNLLVSHLAMLPFLILFLYSSMLVARYLIPGPLSKWLVLALVLDTTFLAQATLVSPDVVLAGAYLLAVHGIFTDHTPSRFYGVLGLSMISLRGIILVVFLLGMDLVLIKQDRQSNLMKKINHLTQGYIPFIFLGLGFILYHYLEKGWVGTHPGSPWAPSFKRVEIMGFLKNLVTFSWRLFDLGHIFMISPALFIIYRMTGLPQLNKKSKQLMVLFFGTTLFLFPQLFFQGLMGYRYFLPLYLSTTLMVFFGLYYFVKHRVYATILGIVLILGMLSGHFWFYPRYAARGWDSSLAYLPYAELMDKAKTYLNRMEIPFSAVGTAFPNLRSEYFSHLNNNRRIFKEKDLEKDPFILYSNVMNDFTDEEIKVLFAEWNVVQGWKKGSVEVILFKK